MKICHFPALAEANYEFTTNSIVGNWFILAETCQRWEERMGDIYMKKTDSYDKYCVTQRIEPTFWTTSIAIDLYLRQQLFMCGWMGELKNSKWNSRIKLVRGVIIMQRYKQQSRLLIYIEDRPGQMRQQHLRLGWMGELSISKTDWSGKIAFGVIIMGLYKQHYRKLIILQRDQARWDSIIWEPGLMCEL